MNCKAVAGSHLGKFISVFKDECLIWYSYHKNFKKKPHSKYNTRSRLILLIGCKVREKNELPFMEIATSDINFPVEHKTLNAKSSQETLSFVLP